MSVANLRKRAKGLLRDAREGNEPFIWRFKRLHPKYRDIPLKEIQSAISLTDAQLVIAREWGYKHWAELLSASDDIGAIDMSAKLDVVEMIPFIPAKDFEASVRFYEELFDINWKAEGLCQVQAGGSKFLIQDFYEPDYANNCMYQLIVEAVDDLWERLKTSGVLTRHGNVRAAAPVDEAWGKVLYLWGPAGELWHLTERAK